MIECQICKKNLKFISYKHLKSHNITSKEYAQMFPNTSFIDKETLEKHMHKIPWNKPFYPQIFDLCKCGCNEIVYGGIQFVRGHHFRVMLNPMKRKEIVSQFMGDNNSSKRPEVREKISISLRNSEKHKKAMQSEETRQKMRDSQLGKKLSEEQKIKIGIGVKNSEKYQEAIKNPQRGENISKSLTGKVGNMSGKTHPIETIEKMQKSANNRNTDQYKNQISDSVKLLWQDEEYKQKQLDSIPQRSIKISKALKGKLPLNNGYGKRCYYYSQLQGEVCFRSTYELKFAEYLDDHNISWLYETQTFDLGNTTYTPDFYLPTCNLFIEIKGYMRSEAQEKINKFLDIYNEETLKILYKEDLIKLGVHIFDRN